MSKPIEAGCLAIITHPSCYGWPVRVIEWVDPGTRTLPDGTKCTGRGGWTFKSLSGDLRQIAQPTQAYQKSRLYGACREKWLFRIDGNEDQFKAEQNERIADKLLEVG